MRTCDHCGGSLAHRRKDARFCGAPCRAAASRARAAEPAENFWIRLGQVWRKRSAQRRTNSPESQHEAVAA
jgi:hypothetical protein